MDLGILHIEGKRLEHGAGFRVRLLCRICVAGGSLDTGKLLKLFDQAHGPMAITRVGVEDAPADRDGTAIQWQTVVDLTEVDILLAQVPETVGQIPFVIVVAGVGGRSASRPEAIHNS